MARNLKKLTVTGLRHLKQPGRYNDGGGLYLLVNKSGDRYWVFRYRDRTTQKHRDMGLGPERDVDLVDARDKARDCRNMLRDGIDPIDQKKQARVDALLAKAQQVTFKECAQKYIEAHRDSWSNEKHTQQWENTLDTYAETLMPLPVSSIDTALVMQCLEPIWNTKTETATRVRQRIEAVLDLATVHKYRMGDNPARWRGHLDKLLPASGKLKKVKHRPALSYREVGGFMSSLREQNGLASNALELQILTATRPGEVVGARWDEFDLDAALWTIPGERMKAGKEHEIPLSKQAVRLLKTLPNDTAFVFPGTKSGTHLTTAAGMKLLHSLAPGITAHGFRSTFRDWAGDQTNFPREVTEHALSHQLKDKAEAAYARSSLMPKRKKLMQAWANYCDVAAKPGATVTPINAKQGA